MNTKNLLTLGVLLLAYATTNPIYGQIGQNTLNEFDNDVENWVEGSRSGNPPEWIGTNSWNGNPGYIRNLSDGSGQSGRQLMWTDDAQWLGDYLTAGVSDVVLWADNRSGASSSSADIGMRIAFDGSGGWFVSESLLLSDTADGQNEWTALSFALEESNFTWISASGGSGLFADTFSGVTRFEVLAADNLPSYGANGDILRGDSIVSDIRFDSFRPLFQAIPEPSGLGLLSVLAAFGMLRNRKRKPLN